MATIRLIVEELNHLLRYRAADVAAPVRWDDKHVVVVDVQAGVCCTQWDPLTREPNTIQEACGVLRGG